MNLLDWLPITKKETDLRGWNEVDIVIITGDAYVDHPAFGAAVIGRVLESHGYKVALIPQPNWRDDLRDFKKFGKPRLFFGISAGAMDSMVNHYTANKRLRSNDAYTPGGEAGFRPDYATITYSNILKKLYPDTPVIIGGIEASLRRVTHYDYWADELRPTIMLDSKADLGVYGMGELAIVEIAKALDENKKIEEITNVPQTFFLRTRQGTSIQSGWNDLRLASHEECLKDKKTYASNFKNVEIESNKKHANRLLQDVGNHTLYINPPYPTMTEAQIDASFDLPYTRLPHPKYAKRGVIPAYEMIRHSVNIHRGCFGGCAFCTISAHQGKFVASRSKKSIMREVKQVVEMEDFKGYISDLGGPSANMYRMKGKDESLCEKCVRPTCIQPNICKNLDTNHHPLIELYKEVDKMPQVKKATIGSGIRYDLFLTNEDPSGKLGYDEYFEQLMKRHVSGRLKVAPEHSSDEVLKLMRKPSFNLFVKLKKKFDKVNEKFHLNQQLIPYFISSHPACTLTDMAELAVKTKDLGYRLEQVQDFTPTPMTLATEIYYSGYDPYTLKPVFVAKTKQEKLDQQRFFFWYKPENRQYVKNALRKIGKAAWIERLFKANS
ncbi:MAG: YgiQ family radical SAM protein [Lentimicrobiaceae bacterium]|nr:YgiQ family radical SAM protein [Lentimicrobiaceae bacterium]